MEKIVTIKMRQSQAAAWAKWLGEQHVAELPHEICQSIYAAHRLMKGGELELVDLTDFDKAKVKP